MRFCSFSLRLGCTCPLMINLSLTPSRVASRFNATWNPRWGGQRHSLSWYCSLWPMHWFPKWGIRAVSFKSDKTYIVLNKNLYRSVYCNMRSNNKVNNLNILKLFFDISVYLTSFTFEGVPVWKFRKCLDLFSLLQLVYWLYCL